jgi:tetratricopeptide (TPR) repeat protein
VLPVKARLLSAAIALAAGVARADAPSPSPAAVAAARDRYAVGQTLYERARYREAAREFEAAYREAQLPAFLANIGQAYRKLGHRAVARDYYQRYHALAPDDRAAHHAEREAVAGYLAEVARAIATDGPGPPLPVEAPPPVRERVVTRIVERPVLVPAPREAGPAWYRSRAGWAVTGLAVAAAAAGGGLAGATTAAVDDARSSATAQEWLDARDRARAFSGGSIACLTVGGALLVGAVVAFALHSRLPAPASRR